MTRAEARDAVLTLFRTKWLTLATPPTLLYDDVAGEEPTNGAAWARVSFQEFGGAQATLGETGTRHFDHFGIVTAQIFTPTGDGLDLSDILVEKATDAFEGESTGHIWFKNVRTIDLGTDGDWYQVNVKADFLYTRIK